jgi:hypothetical protein
MSRNFATWTSLVRTKRRVPMYASANIKILWIVDELNETRLLHEINAKITQIKFDWYI